MSPNSVNWQICHQIQWITKCVTNYPTDPTSDSRVWPWCWVADCQPRLVLRAPVTQQLISNPTPPDFEKVENRSVILLEWSISVEGIGKCVESSGNVKHQKGIRPSLTHELWCDHVLDIKHSTSFCRYAMHVSESLRPKCGNMVESFAEGRFAWFFATLAWERGGETKRVEIEQKLLPIIII